MEIIIDTIILLYILLILCAIICLSLQMYDIVGDKIKVKKII